MERGRRACSRPGSTLGAEWHRGMLRTRVRYRLQRPQREFWSVLQRLQRRYGPAGMAMNWGRRAAAGQADLAWLDDPG